MLRGVNVGAHHRIKMDALRGVYESAGLAEPRTYVQSGNVLFRAKQQNASALARKIQTAIGGGFGFRPEVIVRTPQEFKLAIAANPFAKRGDVEPGKLLVTFLSGEPGAEAQATIRGLKAGPEELHLIGRELYIYFPTGAGKSKLPWSSVEKLLKVTGTARNLNSVVKMMEMAEEMEKEG